MIKDLINSISKYPEEKWAEEMDAKGIIFTFNNGYSFGGPLSCPSCKTIGFYGPRANTSPDGNIIRKYRACKFCGLWQESWGHIFDERGGNAYRCIHLLCVKCGTYNWTIANPNKKCENCGGDSRVVDWPSDDPSHPYNGIKKQFLQLLEDQKPV